MSLFSLSDIDQQIQSFLDPALHGSPKILSDSIRYSLSLPGKRIRPRLSLATAELVDLNLSVAWPFVSALEMIHCFSLIHDDLPCMDNDDFRRGKPSNHKVYGESIALLAGDALLCVAFQVLNQSLKLTARPESYQNAFHRFVSLIGPSGVIGGQALEIETPENQFTVEILQKIHALKTGALFDASILPLADLASIEENTTPFKVLVRFSYAYGKLFQALDDRDDLKQDAERKNLNLFYYDNPEKQLDSARDSFIEASDQLVSIYPHRNHKMKELIQEILEKI